MKFKGAIIVGIVVLIGAAGYGWYVYQDRDTFDPLEAHAVIRQYYNLIDRNEFEAARALLSDARGARIDMEKWIEGYKYTESHTIGAIICHEQQCTVQFTATEDRSSDLRRTDYTVRFDMLRDQEGNIRIDHGVLIDKELVRVIDYKNQDVDTQDAAIITSVVKVFCFDQTGTIEQGSGTVIGPDGTVLTNLHLTNDATNACTFYFSNEHGLQTQQPYYIGEVLDDDPELDYLLLALLDEPDVPPLQIPLCRSKDVAIGDTIRVYGYPDASGGNITVTEGLISSIDEDGNHFVTSAKIDVGNSGGIAIHSKNQCIVGMPSAVSAGELESFGLILNINAIDDIEDYVQ